MKKFLIITLIIILTFCIVSVSYATNFSDTSNHWAETYINRWSQEGIINGYEDGTFKPNNNITRAEYITMIVRIFKPTDTIDATSYSDVDSSAWYYDSLSKACAMEIIKGYEDNTVRPNANITRQEAMVILNRILKLNTSSGEVVFADSNEIASWAKEAVEVFSEKGYINGYEDGTIRPNAFITRAEIAKILDKSIPAISVTPVVDSGDKKLDDVDNDKDTEKFFKITLTTNGDKYDVKKEGNLTDGAKISLIVDDNTIINEKVFSKLLFSQFKLDLMKSMKNAVKSKQIDLSRLSKTIEEDSNTKLENGIIDLLPAEDKQMINEILGDTSGKTLTELYKSLSDDEIMDLATIFLDIDYDTVKDIINKL